MTEQKKLKDDETPISRLFEKLEDYSRTTIELYKLKAIDHSAQVLSSLASRMAIFLLIALFTVFISIGFAWWIGELLGKIYYGFFVVGGIYILIAVLLYNFRQQWIKYPVSNYIIIQFSKL